MATEGKSAFSSLHMQRQVYVCPNMVVQTRDVVWKDLVNAGFTADAEAQSHTLVEWAKMLVPSNYAPYSISLVELETRHYVQLHEIIEIQLKSDPGQYWPSQADLSMQHQQVAETWFSFLNHHGCNVMRFLELYLEQLDDGKFRNRIGERGFVGALWCCAVRQRCSAPSPYYHQLPDYLLLASMPAFHSSMQCAKLMNVPVFREVQTLLLADKPLFPGCPLVAVEVRKIMDHHSTGQTALEELCDALDFEQNTVWGMPMNVLLEMVQGVEKPEFIHTKPKLPWPHKIPALLEVHRDPAPGEAIHH